jgi:hypothetical protein
MPPVIREPVRLGQLCSTTMRSVYAPEDAPCSDAFHPDRWSNPPPVGLAPIVPCDEPEEDEAVQVLPRLELTPASAPLEPAPASAATLEEPEPPEPPTERWQPRAVSAPLAVEPPADEPVVLPFRDRDPAPGNRLLLLAAVTSATLLLALVSAVLVWA